MTWLVRSAYFSIRREKRIPPRPLDLAVMPGLGISSASPNLGSRLWTLHAVSGVISSWIPRCKALGLLTLAWSSDSTRDRPLNLKSSFRQARRSGLSPTVSLRPRRLRPPKGPVGARHWRLVFHENQRIDFHNGFASIAARSLLRPRLFVPPRRTFPNRRPGAKDSSAYAVRVIGPRGAATTGHNASSSFERLEVGCQRARGGTCVTTLAVEYSKGSFGKGRKSPRLEEPRQAATTLGRR
jgi:hypothetical protein